jgi:hypothetical protein
MKKVKGLSKSKQAHTMNTKYGMGDFYGSGIRAKQGKIRDMNLPGVNPVQGKKLKKPPKTLA